MWSHEWYDTRNRRNALRMIPVRLHWLSRGQLISKPHKSYTYPSRRDALHNALCKLATSRVGDVKKKDVPRRVEEDLLSFLHPGFCHLLIQYNSKVKLKPDGLPRYQRTGTNYSLRTGVSKNYWSRVTNNHPSALIPTTKWIPDR